MDSQQRKELLEQVDRFCQNEVLPHMEEDDEKGYFRPEIFQGFAQLGLTGLTTEEAYEGAALGYQDLCAVLEKIAHYSVPYAITLSVSSMVQGLIQQFANEQQKQKYLPPLASGQAIGAFSLSESHSGSDAASLKTTAKKVEGGYELNGTKMWVTSGGIAETYIVMARTGEAGPKGISAFIVEKDTAGLSFGKAEKKMGWTLSPTRELIFERCFIPEEQRLAQEGEGFKMAMAALDRGRITIGAIGVGVAQAALDYAIAYSLRREQFQKAIFEFQGLQFMMADDATEIECSRLLVQRAAKDFDEKHINQKLAAMAKMKATDTAMNVCTNAVQILGGVGYTKEYPVERFMRDAKVLQIVEGTNQIQKVIIARELQRHYQ